MRLTAQPSTTISVSPIIGYVGDPIATNKHYPKFRWGYLIFENYVLETKFVNEYDAAKSSILPSIF